MRARVEDGASTELRWGVERRLEFIEFRLFWEGRINRADLTGFFGISQIQASTDMARYDEVAPGNAAYDRSVKCFVRGSTFTPRIFKPDAARYLNQLRSIVDGVLGPAETWLAQIPAFDAVPIPRREVDASKLLGLLDAIHSKSAVNVRYQSMSRPEPKWRWITPHALGFDGFRWHVRAYCHLDKVFKDFLISRILGIKQAKPDGVDPAADRAWQTITTLRLAPHPALTDGQKRVVELDYGMVNGELAITTRVAFIYYLMKRLGLDIDPDIRRPQDQHIILLNKPEIDALMGEVSDG